MYSAVGGMKIANEGEKDIAVVTGANEVVHTNWQTVNITRPLSSARPTCLQETGVLFGAYNIERGQETPFGVEDNVYFP